MSPEELEVVVEKLLSNPVVASLHTLLPYKEFANASVASVHADLNDFGAVRPLYGDYAADEAMKTLTRYFVECAERFSGTPFLYGSDQLRCVFDSVENAHAFASAVKERLEATPAIGGTHALSACFGIGAGTREAHGALLAAKKELGEDYDSSSTPNIIHSVFEREVTS